MIKLNNAQREVEKTRPQILAILIATLAGVNNGMLNGWGSPFLIQISQDKKNYDITEEEGSYFNTIPPLAMMLASPIFSKLSDVIGRKRTLLIIIGPQICSWLLTIFATSVYTFYVARIMAGCADACFYAVLPIYIGEISSPAVRGTWGNLLASCYYVGQFLINVIGSYFGVRGTAYICIPLPIIFFILFSFMPESPYYYLIKDQEEDAKNALKFLKCKDNIEDSLFELKNDVTRQMSESATWYSLIKIESNRKALIAATFLRISQQTSGMLVFTAYAQFIFQKSGQTISPQLSSIIYLGLQVFLSLMVSMFVVKRFSRRACFLASVCGTGVILYMMATYYYINGNVDLDISGTNWFPITGMITYLILASFGIAAIPTLMLSELFSASIKAKAMVIAILAFGLGNTFINYIFYFINSSLGFYAPFYLFAICNTVSVFVGYFIIPETNGKTLEEIQQNLKNNIDFKKNSLP